MNIKSIGSVLVALGLAACSGGGGGSDSTVVEPGDNSTPNLVADGMSSRMEQEIGQFAVGQLNVVGSSPLQVYQTGPLMFASSSVNHVLFDITLSKARFYESRVNYPQIADYSGTGSISNTTPFDGDPFTITYESEDPVNAAIYDQTADLIFPDTNSLSILSGTYTQQFGPYPDYVNISITIDSDGVLTGSTDSGCVFNGTVTNPISTRNAYYFETEISNCDEVGTYQGAGYLEEHINGNAAYLNLQLFSNNIAMAYRLYQN